MNSKPRAIAVIDLGDFSGPDAGPAVSRFAERKLDGQSLVVRMARRLSECTLVDEIYVVGGNVPSSPLIRGIVGLHSINLPESHACERFCAAAEASGAEWVVCVPPNRPFVDAILIDQLLTKAFKTPNCDYVGYTSNSGNSLRIRQLGLAGEACHIDTLRRLRCNSDRLPADQVGSVVSWLENAPGAYYLKFIPIPLALDCDDLRFAIENESDWDDAELLCETIVGEDSQWQDLTQLLRSHHGLRQSMAMRNS